MKLKRAIPHLLYPDWWLRRVFTPAILARIESAIAESESHHRAEIRFALEATLDFKSLWRDQTARDRATDVFGQLRVWDTVEDNGVLIYLLLAERDVEIIADRGFLDSVNAHEWEALCRAMESDFRAGRFEEGVLSGIRQLDELLTRLYPLQGPNSNELPNGVALL